MLDDVRVYNRELTADEVLEVMHSARRQSAVYDVAGNLVQKTDRDGRVTQYVYDPLNRQVEENWLDADSNVFHTIHTYYDADGQVLGISESDTQNAAAGTLYQYTYDADGRVTSARMAPGDLSQPGPPSASTMANWATGSTTTSRLGRRRDEPSAYDTLQLHAGRGRRGAW